MLLFKSENISDNKYPSRLEDVDFSEFKEICKFLDHKLNQACDEDASDNNDGTEDLTLRNIVERGNIPIASPYNLSITTILSHKIMKDILLKVQVFVKSYRETHTSRFSNSSQGDGTVRTVLNYSTKVKNSVDVEVKAKKSSAKETPIVKERHHHDAKM
jgi:hypothetical protein